MQPLALVQNDFPDTQQGLLCRLLARFGDIAWPNLYRGCRAGAIYAVQKSLDLCRRHPLHLFAKDARHQKIASQSSPEQCPVVRFGRIAVRQVQHRAAVVFLPATASRQQQAKGHDRYQSHGSEAYTFAGRGV